MSGTNWLETDEDGVRTRLLFAHAENGAEVKPGTAEAELVNRLLDKLYDDLMDAGIEMVDFQEVDSQE